jgi:hypothetical protein
VTYPAQVSDDPVHSTSPDDDGARWLGFPLRPGDILLSTDRLPDASGAMVDAGACFRRGSSGAGAEVLAPEELAAYDERAAYLIQPQLSAWLLR